MLLKVRLTNLEDTRRCRQLMHCSLFAYDLLSVPRGVQERPTVWIEKKLGLFPATFVLLQIHNKTYVCGSVDWDSTMRRG